jgi:hypothetical protein
MNKGNDNNSKVGMNKEKNADAGEGGSGSQVTAASVSSSPQFKQVVSQDPGGE